MSVKYKDTLNPKEPKKTLQQWAIWTNAKPYKTYFKQDPAKKVLTIHKKENDEIIANLIEA